MTNDENDETLRATCDLIIERAVAMMLEQGGSLPMILDRLTTYAVAQTVAAYGLKEADNLLRVAAEALRTGSFDHLEAQSGGIEN
jgi:hypothetical protein